MNLRDDDAIDDMREPSPMHALFQGYKLILDQSPIGRLWTPSFTASDPCRSITILNPWPKGFSFLQSCERWSPQNIHDWHGDDDL